MQPAQMDAGRHLRTIPQSREPFGSMFAASWSVREERIVVVAEGDQCAKWPVDCLTERLKIFS